MTGAQEELATLLLIEALDCIGCELLTREEQERCEDVQLRIERLLHDLKQAPKPRPCPDLYHHVMLLRDRMEAAIFERDNTRSLLNEALRQDNPCSDRVTYLVRRLQRAWRGVEEAEWGWQAAEADYYRSLTQQEGRTECHG